MNEIDLSGISISRLQIFVSAAESKSFTNAAQKLNLTHSAISKNIAKLEQQLNLLLFIKENNTIILTPAGRYLYEKCKELINAFSDYVERAGEIQTGKIFSLSIGFTYDLLLNNQKDKIKEFHERYPNVDITIQNLNGTELCKRFNQNKLDIIFISNLNISLLEAEGIKCKIAYPCKMAIIFNNNHRLANKEEITISDLKGENFIAISKDNLPEYNSLLYSICKPYGFEPRINKIASSLESSLMYAEMGLGIIVAIDTFDYPKHFNLKKYVFNEKMGSVILAWHENNKNPFIRKFIDSN